ncbi:MAG: TetR/AcrR family transcriptional regulator [Acidimicrobiia bacterium]|nr:TetR/AcrR family transcriptional regulator [Acidimicrobiia bacterium]
MAEEGYSGLSMEAVATRAGVGKPTVYRRWPTRAHLVFAAATNDGRLDPTPDHGDLRSDLLAVLNHAATSMAANPRDAVADRIAAIISDADFSATVWAEQFDPQLDHAHKVWERAVERGEVSPDVDGRAILDDLRATLFWQVIAAHRQLSHEDVEEMLDRHLDGCELRPPTKDTSNGDAVPTSG